MSPGTTSSSRILSSTSSTRASRLQRCGRTDSGAPPVARTSARISSPRVVRRTCQTGVFSHALATIGHVSRLPGDRPLRGWTALGFLPHGPMAWKGVKKDVMHRILLPCGSLFSWPFSPALPSASRTRARPTRHMGRWRRRLLRRRARKSRRRGRGRRRQRHRRHPRPRRRLRRQRRRLRRQRQRHLTLPLLLLLPLPLLRRRRLLLRRRRRRRRRRPCRHPGRTRRFRWSSACARSLTGARQS